MCQSVIARCIVSPCGIGDRDKGSEGDLDAARALLPVGWHCHPCWDRTPGPSHCHLLHLCTAQGLSLQQETIAFPSASPTLGKPPRQPAEQISGASHVGTEPPPCRAGEPGICRLASDSPMAGCQPSAAPGVLCQLRPRGCVPGEPRDREMPAKRVTSPAPGRHGAGPASRMERCCRGSWRAAVSCIPAAAPTLGDDARWPGDWCVGWGTGAQRQG